MLYGEGLMLVIMFKLMGAPFARNINMSFKYNYHKVYQNYGTLCHIIGQVRTQNMLTRVAKTSNLYFWLAQNPPKITSPKNNLPDNDGAHKVYCAFSSWDVH